jgi:hypothetical protein
MFPTRLVQKPPFVPNLLPARPSFVCQDNLPVQYGVPKNVTNVVVKSKIPATLSGFEPRPSTPQPVTLQAITVPLP